MKLLFLGFPGSGKGTYAKMLASKMSVPHVSTGDIFRKMAEEGYPLGVRARDDYWGRGNLVPDDITLELVLKKLKSKEYFRRYILDGFPRTLPQAEAFDNAESIDAAIHFVVDEKTAAKRMLDRILCRGCGAIYNKTTMPSKNEKVCGCGGEIYQRIDDSDRRTINNRLEVYKKQTFPLIQHYSVKGLLTSIDASKPVYDVVRDIERFVSRKSWATSQN